MDLSETYRNIARKYFPSATIVADLFHVIRLVNAPFVLLVEPVVGLLQVTAVEIDRGALFAVDFLDAQDIAFSCAVLFAAAAKNRIHRIVLRAVSRADLATH